MSNAFWEAQRAIAHAELWDAAAAAGQRWADNRRQERYNRELQAEYARALEAAKTTGEIPKHLQEHVEVDQLGDHIGIKVVALRELKKLFPTHPLVTSQGCRDAVAKVTLIQYNRANRPDKPFKNYAPDDETADTIFKAYGDSWKPQPPPAKQIADLTAKHTAEITRLTKVAQSQLAEAEAKFQITLNARSQEVQQERQERQKLQEFKVRHDALVPKLAEAEAINRGLQMQLDKARATIGQYEKAMLAAAQTRTNEAAQAAADLAAQQEARDQAAFDHGAEHDLAVATAAVTGHLPVQFQQMIPADRANRATFLAAGLQRELSVVAPDHPLVTSAECRKAFTDEAMRNFNRGLRAKGKADTFLPDAEVTGRIFKASGAAIPAEGVAETVADNALENINE